MFNVIIAIFRIFFSHLYARNMDIIYQMCLRLINWVGIHNRTMVLYYSIKKQNYKPFDTSGRFNAVCEI